MQSRTSITPPPRHTTLPRRTRAHGRDAAGGLGEGPDKKFRSYDMSGRIAAKIDWATDWDRDAALTTAKLLLEIKAVNFWSEEPYRLPTAWKSPVYIDCHKSIYFPRA